MVDVPPGRDRLIRELILDGRSDDEIAAMLHISVKLIRPLRAALEAAIRPR